MIELLVALLVVLLVALCALALFVARAPALALLAPLRNWLRLALLEQRAAAGPRGG